MSKKKEKDNIAHSLRHVTPVGEGNVEYKLSGDNGGAIEYFDTLAEARLCMYDWAIQNQDSYTLEKVTQIERVEYVKREW